MHVWTLSKWKRFYDLKSHRTGLHLRFDKNVESEVKRACMEFAIWLRKKYMFPMRVVIYFKNTPKIKAHDGELVSATFFRPDNKYVEPYIRIAVGDYMDLLKKYGNKDNALASNLHSMAHELTHYFQWINDIKLTKIGEERQATMYSNYIIDEYSETREHP